VQGGSNDRNANEEAASSLGSLFVEPLWLFYRADAARKKRPGGEFTRCTQLQDLRVNVGFRRAAACPR
jgi:hypothetical protein